MHLFSDQDQGACVQHHRRLWALRPLRLAIMATLVLSLLPAVSLTPHRAQAATFTQIWSDEFNGAAGPINSSTNWQFDLGTSYPGGAAHWGTGEVETMTNSQSNVRLDGSGHLVITPIHTGSNAATGWTSARIETQRTDFAAPANGILAVEASIQQPNVTNANGLGYWPAFWMLGAPFRGVFTNWPSIGEIDIMEDINGLSAEFGTLHCGTSPGGPCHETTGIGSGRRACSACQTGFHTYRMELDKSVSPNQIRWFLDGVNFFTVNAKQVDATTWANATNHGFFIIFDLAIGGGFPAAFGGGPTGATVSGASMLVDYVRVFTAGGTAPTPTPTPSGPTPTRTPTPRPGTPTATPTPSSCPSGSFITGVVNSGATTALPWFKPCGWTAGYVILHYIRPDLSQQNVQMAFNGGTARWEFTVSGMSAGQVLQYAFTYQKGGLQFDTGWSSWTHPPAGG